MIEPLTSVACVGSAEAVDRLLRLVKAEDPVLDVTFGSGVFWSGSERRVFGVDLNPARARHVCADFRSLPFADAAFPTVVYDPPYHPNVQSIEQERFGYLGESSADLELQFVLGLHEAWRVTSNILLVKCQHFVNGGTVQWMELWATRELGEPYEWLTTWRKNKRVSSRWKNVRSLRRNHASYLVFRKKGKWLVR